MTMAGNFDTQITIERKQVTTDATYGTEVITWVPLVAQAGSPTIAQRFWAQVQDVLPSRSESVQQGLDVARNQSRLRMRYRTDIDSSMRVMVHYETDVLYQIVGGPARIGGRKAMIELVLEGTQQMADTFVNVKGLAELQKFLDQLPAKVEANIMRGALRAGMIPVAQQAKANIRSQSGELAKGLKIGTRIKGQIVSSVVKVKGKHAFIGHMLEFTGAVAHDIKPKKAKSLFIAGLFGQIVHHPGFRPRPFLRPALDSKASAAVVAAGEYIKKRLETKQGLDTSYIKIEGDE